MAIYINYIEPYSYGYIVISIIQTFFIKILIKNIFIKHLTFVSYAIFFFQIFINRKINNY
jgi:hypothetical protein